MNVIGFEEQEGMGWLYLITALNKTPTKNFIQNSEFFTRIWGFWNDKYSLYEFKINK